jgi:hypothetical protein
MARIFTEPMNREKQMNEDFIYRVHLETNCQSALEKNCQGNLFLLLGVIGNELALKVLEPYDGKLSQPVPIFHRDTVLRGERRVLLLLTYPVGQA